MPLSGGLLGTLLVRMHRNNGNAADKGNEGAQRDLLRVSPARPERTESNKKYTKTLLDAVPSLGGERFV